jgi:NAD(P)-dependent dehydrogenase (short-subunit alcohol dehydrogenase family)
MSLGGKTAVITGASRGIGAAVARRLHVRGVGAASGTGDDLGLRIPETALCPMTEPSWG